MSTQLVMIPASWSTGQPGDVDIVRRLRRTQKSGICCRRVATLRNAYVLALYLHLSGENECETILRAMLQCNFTGNHDQWHFIECALVLQARRMSCGESAVRAALLARIDAAGYVRDRLAGCLIPGYLVNIKAAIEVGSSDAHMAWRETLFRELSFIVEMLADPLERKQYEEMLSENIDIMRKLAGIAYVGQA